MLNPLQLRKKNNFHLIIKIYQLIVFKKYFSKFIKRNYAVFVNKIRRLLGDRRPQEIGGGGPGGRDTAGVDRTSSVTLFS